jgi:hypothetical protein
MRPLDRPRGPDDRGSDDAAVDYNGATRTFDQVERLHLCKRLEPDFEWLDFDQPSPRNPLRVPLRQARVGLVVTAGVHLPECGWPSWACLLRKRERGTRRPGGRTGQ